MITADEPDVLPDEKGPQLFETASGILEYEEIGHTYRMPGGIKPRGLTQMLRDQGIADSDFLSEVAAERGSEVHAAIPLAIAGTLDWNRLPEHIFPYVTAAMDCLAALRAEAIETEQAVFSFKYQTAGKPDGIFQIHTGTPRQRLALLEWKSISGGRVPHPAAKIQTAGYVAMKYEMDGTLIPDRYAVALMPTGKFNLIHYTDPLDVEEFKAAAFVNFRRRQRGQLK